MNYETLFYEIRNHRDSSIQGLPLSDQEVSQLEAQEGVEFPYIYRCFLKEFGVGGEFVFARMRTFDDLDMMDHFWEYWSKILGDDAKSRYLPVGDDYSGNYYCFELSPKKDDCPILAVDDLLIDAPDTALRFDSFESLIRSALLGQGVFAE